MHAETPAMNLKGFRNMTAILAYCANEPVHVGGAKGL
jgi:hypothetical protein